MLKFLQEEGAAICRNPRSINSEWLLFRSPEKIFLAREISEVMGVVEAAWEESISGKWVAGFLSYEASPAFDPAMEVISDTTKFPLAYFAIYSEVCETFEGIANDVASNAATTFEPEISKETHCGRLREVLGFIDRGDCYQVDLTLRLRSASCKESPGRLFTRLAASHQTPLMGYFNTGDIQIVSLSPELFLEKHGDKISTEPMKGTARRETDAEKDRKKALWLASDEKNRAENLMIVDMCRNDLGRICVPGSVKTPELFKVVSYPTVHQMISRVEGTLPKDCDLVDILKASFPPASITGAPKIMAMSKIAAMESSPRKLYTGCAGCIAPGGDFLFNVAIRTIIFDRQGVELGVGGGIVSDSKPEDEWDECMAKSAFASQGSSQFKLIETLLWARESGFHLEVEHKTRARESQQELGRRWNETAFDETLRQLNLEDSNASFARIRLLIDANGNCEATWTQLEAPSWGKPLLKVMLSSRRSNSSNLLLRHKTTSRELYDKEFKAAHEKGFDEVIFLNEKGELTEGAISNIAVKDARGGQLTPKGSCGVLKGIWLDDLRRREEIAEASITLQDLLEAMELQLGNSVRGGAQIGEVWQEGQDGGLQIIWSQRRNAQRQ